jgi:hypothetical protein
MNSRYGNKFNNSNKAQKLLKDHEDEENKGFKMKGPHGRKSHQDVFKDDYEDIEEEIQSDDNEKHGGNKAGSVGGESSSARGFGITVSQSLGIDKSVDSMALDEYDHIEDIE